MANFYNGNATTVRGANKLSGKLVFTDSYCEFSSPKYNYREDFDDIRLLSVSATNISVPSIFGAKNKEGISVCYSNSNIGDFVLEEGNAPELVSKVMSYVRAEKDRIEQEENRRKEAQKADEAKKEAQKEKEDVMEKRSYMEERLKELKKDLDSFPPDKQNDPRVLELKKEYERMKADIDGGYSQYEAYLKQQETRERERKEELERKKAEAKGNVRGEVDEAFMYITLLMESAAGNPHEEDEAFAKTYADDFAAYDETQIIQLRNKVKATLQNEGKCQQYLELFNKQPLADRFNYSAGNLFTISTKGMNSLDVDQEGQAAIDETEECFSPDEMSEVKRLMDEKTGKIRKQLDDQFKSIEPEWMEYNTTKNYLIIEVTSYNGNNYQKLCEFQKLIDQKVVTVKISTKGLMSMSTGVGNIFRWYWGANVRDIWEEAVGNKVNSPEELTDVKFDLVKAAFDEVCEKWPSGSAEKKSIIKEVFLPLNQELAEWMGSRGNRSFFSALAFGVTSPSDGSENPNTPYALQAVVNDTIYVTNGENKIEAHFYGDSRAVIITYIPYLKHGYYRVIENNIGTTEDDLDDYFDDEINAKRILKAYHVERDEFQVSFEQLNNMFQQNQG